MPGAHGGSPRNEARKIARARTCGLSNHRVARSSTDIWTSSTNVSASRPPIVRAIARRDTHRRYPTVGRDRERPEQRRAALAQLGPRAGVAGGDRARSSRRSPRRCARSSRCVPSPKRWIAATSRVRYSRPRSSNPNSSITPLVSTAVCSTAPCSSTCPCHSLDINAPPGNVVLLDHDHVEAGPREVGGADQAVVAASDDDDVDARVRHVIGVDGDPPSRDGRPCAVRSVVHLGEEVAAHRPLGRRRRPSWHRSPPARSPRARRASSRTRRAR